MQNESVLTSAEAPELNRRVIVPQEYVPAGPPVSSSLLFPPGMHSTPLIAVGSRRYRLQGLFIIEFTYLEDGVAARHREIPVEGFGSTQMESMDEFFNHFDFQYRNLVEVDEATLTPGGRARRAALVQVVSAVLND